MKAPDRIDAAQHAFVQIVTNPASWAAFAPIAAAYAFLGFPWWLCVLLAFAVATAVCLVWAKRWPHLTERAYTALLQKHRQLENAELYGRLGRVGRALSHLPTRRLLYELREAMEIKHAVEARVFADGIITPHEEEVGDMFAGMVRSMMEEAERGALTDSRDWPKAAARLEKAMENLRRAFDQIDVILDPIPEDMRLPAESDPLTRASERLNERVEQAQGVRRHLERGMIVRDVETASQTEASHDPAPRQPTAEN